LTSSTCALIIESPVTASIVVAMLSFIFLLPLSIRRTYTVISAWVCVRCWRTALDDVLLYRDGSEFLLDRCSSARYKSVCWRAHRSVSGTRRGYTGLYRRAGE